MRDLELLEGTRLFLRADGYVLNTEFFDAPIPMKDGSTRPVGELLDRFNSHDLGRHFALQTPRYSQYFDRSDYRRLPELVGADVVPHLHQRETALYAAWLLASDCEKNGLLQLDEQERATTVLASGLHDVGENTHRHIKNKLGFVVGDIPYGKKNG